MKNLEYTTIETMLPVEAVKLLDQFVGLFGESTDWNRQEFIEIAVMDYLYGRRNSGSKEFSKTFKKDVVRFFNEWESADDEGQEAA
jgi:hypothetical protein